MIASDPLMIVGKTGSTGERPQGADRLAEGQPRQGVDRHSGGVGTGASRWLSSERDRHQAQLHSVSRHRPGVAGSGRRPDRSADRAGVQLLRSGQGRSDQALRDHVKEAQHGGRRHPDHRRGRDGRVSIRRCGTACGRRRTRRRTSSQNSTRRCSKRWRTRRRASALPTLGIETPPREQQTPERLARHQKTEARQVVADHQGRQHQRSVQVGGWVGMFSRRREFVVGTCCFGRFWSFVRRGRRAGVRDGVRRAFCGERGAIRSGTGNRGECVAAAAAEALRAWWGARQSRSRDWKTTQMRLGGIVAGVCC